MGTDFPARATASNVTIIATNGAGVSSVPWAESMFVFPWPEWLQLAVSIDSSALKVAAGKGEVTESISFDYPDPHIEDGCTVTCAGDPNCSKCSRIPDYIPFLNGTFDLLETYAQVKGTVSSSGTGNLSLQGQTGFFALGGGQAAAGILGTARGSGTFRLSPPSGFTLTSASFTLGLAGTLSKTVGVADAIPALASLEGIPIIGSGVEWFNKHATLTGEISSKLDLAASFAQRASTGNLEFADGTGTLGLDLGATLAVELVPHLNASGWVSGGGSFTVGVPAPYLRQGEVHFEAGVGLDFDYLFHYTRTATFDAGCTWTPDTRWQCSTDRESASASSIQQATARDEIELVEPHYDRFGPYSSFQPRRRVMAASSQIPVSVRETSMITNLFLGASPELLQVGGGALLLWEQQDPNLPVLQSTDIAWSYFNGSAWSAPALIAHDTRVELQPVAGVDTYGNVVAVWLRIKDNAFSTPIATATDLPSFYTRLEVVTATFTSSTQKWGPITPLTDNNNMDTDLHLAADGTGHLMLTWLSNSSGEFVSTPSSPSSLMYSFWDGTKWSVPASLATGLVGVASHAAAIHGSSAFVIVPRDPDPGVSGDEVLDLYSWNGTRWNAATTFAAGGVDSRLPSVAYDSTGVGHVVWVRGNDLVHATLGAPSPQVIRPGSASMAFYGVRLCTNSLGNLTLLWQEVVDNGPANIFGALYDPASSTWSSDRRLNQDAWLAHDVSGYYGTDGSIHLVYLATEIQRTTKEVTLGGQPWTMTNIPVAGQTDLRLLDHSLIVDLAVTDGDLAITPGTPAVGDSVTTTLIVHNAGDFPVSSFDVDLYVGNPDSGGILVGRQTVLEPLPAGAVHDLSFSFTYPSTPGDIVAVVDPNNSVSEITTANNRATFYLTNRPPRARVVADVTTGKPPLTVTFDASGSSDPDGDVMSFDWAFADGGAGAAGVSATHTFSAPGSYAVVLAATDSHGAVGTATVTITVLGVDHNIRRKLPAMACLPPTIISQPPSQTISSGQTATLSVSATGTAPLHYQWYQGYAGDRSNPVGGDSATFTTPALVATTSFWVRLNNACGLSDSNVATISVQPPKGGTVTCTPWQVISPPPAPENLNSITWGNGQLLAASDAGRVLFSTDGEAWREQPTTTSNQLFSVAFGNGRYVAVGWNEVITVSSDGVTWSTVHTGAQVPLQSVVWTGSIFVVVGLDVILTSRDGITWTRQATNSWLEGIASGGGKIVAVGGNAIFATTDGSAWNQVYTAQYALHAVIWTGDQFVAVGDAGGIFTSADGTTWTNRNWGGGSLVGVAWTGSLLVATFPNGIVVTSSDGVHWADQELGGVGSQMSIASAVGRLWTVGAQGLVAYTTCSPSGT
jgi:PKD repeat protein